MCSWQDAEFALHGGLLAAQAESDVCVLALTAAACVCVLFLSVCVCVLSLSFSVFTWCKRVVQHIRILEVPAPSE